MAKPPSIGRTAATLFLLLSFITITAYLSFADPTGATITFNSTAGTPTYSPDSRTDARGTITTIVLDVLQQDQYWKAYVGNITGSLSLDDADGFTIYDWTLNSGVAGEVYVSRFSSPTFTNVSCITDTILAEEHTFFGMTATQDDGINMTYNETNHQAIVIGGFGTVTADTCRSMATFMNSTRQAIDGGQAYQSVLLQDSSNRSIFVTIIDDDQYSYDNDISLNKTNDFQIIVPESATNSTSTTYYFWTELG